MSFHYQRLGEDVESTPLYSTKTNSGGEKKSMFARMSLLAVLFLAFAGYLYTTPTKPQSFGLSSTEESTSKSSSSENFDAYGRYIMRNFDQVKPMSNFLAGLGGLWGIPMWAFYCNRGQGIAGFGVQNKDGSIMKFSTAEKAYLITPFAGFRTFLKGRRGKVLFTAMPFFPVSADSHSKPERNMMIGQNEMEIEEVAEDIALKTNILYFTIPDEDFPGLVRRTTFTNLDKKSSLHLEVLDGLGKLIPAGLSNSLLDALGRTMEAWMNVFNMHGDNTQPFYHISQGTADTAQVQIIKEGHFVVSFIEGVSATYHKNLHDMLPFIVDPSVVFGTDTTLMNPTGFYENDIEDLLKQNQGTTSRTPCAFAGAKLKIPAGGKVTVTSVYGHADSLEDFLNTFRDKVRAKGYVQSKLEAATSTVKLITNKVKTVTSSSLFNMYSEQSFLDNVLRGGMPLVLGDPLQPKIYHVYSRIHGDLERDYNNFQIDTTPFSQGPGNFRDVNQNRRLDVLIDPKVSDFNVRMFLSFVQADGFNPLIVASTNFKALDVSSLIEKLQISAESVVKARTLLSKPFRIGQLFKDMKDAKVTSSLSKEEQLQIIMTASKQEFAGLYSQNGYWADHWTYTLDLVENFLAVYPDQEERMLYDSAPLPFFMSPAIVKPRSERYVVVNITTSNTTETAVRVYSAVAVKGDPTYPAERTEALANFAKSSSYIADINSQGGIWQQTRTNQTMYVSAIAKLIMLAVNKFSSLDPSGMGVEMEGGKPGWNDAMNGLPGLIGSGMPETYEMLRILNYLTSALPKFDRAVHFPVEFVDFMSALGDAMVTANAAEPSDESDFAYWDATNDAREAYRASVVTYFKGDTMMVEAADLLTALKLMQARTKIGIDKALASNRGISPAYFYYDCVDYIPSDKTPMTATPKGFKLNTLPLFLEGPARHLKVIHDISRRREIYSQTKNSALYDEHLKMFKISGSLKDMGQDVGRMKAFSPGWLENESIWLHMSYKWYLELLRGGLYEEFFTEMKTGLVPFMPADVYGRNPVEASSFIVSSAFPDPKLHGAGFLARLSGSTAEFMSMWAIMMMGQFPFVLGSDGKVALALKPVLPGWMFTASDNTVSFTFLSSTLVTYHNPSRIDTWKLAPKSATVQFGSKEKYDVPTPEAFSAELSVRIRNAEATKIDVFF